MKGLAIFISGVAVGAVAGMLLAPEKGADSRARIKECLRRRGLLPELGEIDIFVEETAEEAPAAADEAEKAK